MNETNALPTADRWIGKMTGQCLTWLARRARDRGDWHEFNHCMAALKVGNSLHDRQACEFPDAFRQGPKRFDYSVSPEARP